MEEKEFLEKREKLKIAIVCDPITEMLDKTGEFLVESSLYEIEDMKECLKNLKKFGYDCIYDEKSKKIIKKKKRGGKYVSRKN
ncbi:hypothetical protein [Fusobacterium ulcerans]|uniref:hypothetical protein n=1 Tax=Fusobacterium ulcerans TaxID=861 RepID=UPI001D0AE285|nr:hypothetical protein [Fusobacterium ulcerans]MCB8564515.1 hypothetical protein [Fusobacterium ulcerans]MCB8648686.1 hypothetical protein [Fusobacterium ulcerans]